MLQVDLELKPAVDHVASGTAGQVLSPAPQGWALVIFPFFPQPTCKVLAARGAEAAAFSAGLCPLCMHTQEMPCFSKTKRSLWRLLPSRPGEDAIQ